MKDSCSTVDAGDVSSEPATEREIGLVIGFGGGVCDSCGYAEPQTPSVSVSQIESTAVGWRAVGVTEGWSWTCPRCGQVHAYLNKVVPVEIAEYPCPKCHDPSRLDYRIVEVKKENEGDAYQFAAEIECRRCAHRGIVKRALDQLERITKLKVGPTGVEIERAAP